MRHSFQFERNAVFASSAAVATSHPTASLTALDVLRKGGNAVDPALAACAVLCVVEPGMTGIGGDCFAIYANRASGKVHAINRSGAAPAAASTAFFLDRNIREIDGASPHAVRVPGAIDAWCQLNRDYGAMTLDEILQPAIPLAEGGYPVHERVAWDWSNAARRLGAREASWAVFLPGGAPPRAGDQHRQPDLATTLRSIARYGRAGFYEGPVAEDMVSTLRSLGRPAHTGGFCRPPRRIRRHDRDGLLRRPGAGMSSEWTGPHCGSTMNEVC